MSPRSWNSDDFERLYADNSDPWDFATSDYERAKYEDTLSVLLTKRFVFCLELGASIGIMTAQLAQICDSVFGVDASATALTQARSRCRDLPNVTFAEKLLPEDWRHDMCSRPDLVIISEILYFMTADDIEKLAVRVLSTCRPEALVVLVNWTGETDTPCSGDEAASVFIEKTVDLGARLSLHQRRETYRIDVLRTACIGTNG